MVVGVSLGQALAGWERERNQRPTLLAIALLALGLLFWMAMRQFAACAGVGSATGIDAIRGRSVTGFFALAAPGSTVAYVNAVVCDRLRIARSDLIGTISSTRLLADDVDWQQLLARTDQHLRIQFEAC